MHVFLSAYCNAWALTVCFFFLHTPPPNICMYVIYMYIYEYTLTHMYT